MYITIGGNLKKNVREKKGKSLISFPDTYVVIDIETTGLDPMFCEIIEISAIKYTNGIKTAEYQSLVKPNEPIDEYITKLTGITNELLKDAPKIQTCILDFYKFVGDSILVGYNVNYDINFLYDTLLQNHNLFLSNNYIDVLRIARKVLPSLKNHKLKTLAEHYKIYPVKLHRAQADCETCNNCYTRLQDDIISSGLSLEEFIKDFNKKHHMKKLRAKEISTNNIYFDSEHPLYEKLCVFTGKLEKMSRADAMQIVVDLGGHVGDNVTVKTNFLILGNNDFCKTIKDGKSAKQKKAEQLILEDYDIEILSENTFYDLIFEYASDNTDNTNNIINQDENGNEDWKSKITTMLDTLIKEKELPERSLHIAANYDRNGDMVTSYSICIYEPEYPSLNKENTDSARNSIVMNIKEVSKNELELLIRESQFNKIAQPIEASIKTVNSDKANFHVIFSAHSQELVSYIKKNVECALKDYTSKASTFGCCSQFIACSDAKHCVHENKLYGKACMYRKHLDEGKIFYGKNKNFDNH